MEEKSLVTINRPQNVYSYDPRNLMLAYGIGLAVCFLILILGAIAYHTNGAVYDSYVSSIIRAAQNPDVSISFQRIFSGIYYELFSNTRGDLVIQACATISS